MELDFRSMISEALKQGWHEGLSGPESVELAVAALTAAADEEEDDVPAAV